MRFFFFPRFPRRSRSRSSNRFVIVVIIIAVVLVLAALLAYYLLVKKPNNKPVLPSAPPPPPPVQPFPSRPIEKWDEVGKPDPPPDTRPRVRGGKGRPESLGDSAINGVMRRLAAGFNECARQHGGVDGSVVRVGFSISPEGGVQGAFAMSPHTRTPLGRCITNVLGGGRFGRSEYGRSDVRWSITLHP
ncbi:MAG: hypothetical protein KDK70_23320 [Myxococcales bacterium]|nr:hypothetical protein [Myxococcales bacterium]